MLISNIVQHRTFHVTSAMANAAVEVPVHAIEAGWLHIINNITEVKKKKKYINFCDPQNSAANKRSDTGSPVITEMDGKPIYGRGYKPCFNRFLLNVQFPNEIKQ